MELVVGHGGGDAAGIVFGEDVAIGIVGVADGAGFRIVGGDQAAERIVSEAANAPGAGCVIGWRAGAAGLSGGGAVLLDAGEVVERVVAVNGQEPTPLSN